MVANWDRGEPRQVELPLGATEDRICGTIDIEKALGEGVKAYEPGLLVTPAAPCSHDFGPCSHHHCCSRATMAQGASRPRGPHHFVDLVMEIRSNYR